VLSDDGVAGRMKGAGIRVRAAGVTLAVALVAAAIVYTPRAWVSDLGPMPDAGEYAMSARNLAHLHGFVIELLGREYPPRYPPGFPLILAPVFWVPGATLASAIHVVAAFAVVAVLLTHALSRRLGGPVAGLLASGALVLRPVFVDWSHQVMTETATIAVATAIPVLLHHRAQRADTARRPFLVATGLLCGAAILMRHANVVFVPAVAIAVMIDPRVRARPWRSVTALGAGPALALGALGFYDQVTFGSVARTGYHYWVPYWHTSLAKAFSLAYAARQPGAVALGPFGGSANLVYYGAYLVSSVSSAWFALAAARGAVVLVRRGNAGARSVVVYAGALTTFLYLTYGLYFYQSGRFMAPLIGMFAALTGVGIADALRQLGRHRELPVRTVTLASAACLLALFGVIVEVRAVARRTYLAQRLVRGASEPAIAQPMSEAVAAYERTLPRGAVVVTGLPLTLLDPLVQRGIGVVGLARTRYWASPQFDATPVFPERTEEVARSIRAGIPVYTDAYSLAMAPTDPRYGPARAALQKFRLRPVGTTRPPALYRLEVDGPLISMGRWCSVWRCDTIRGSAAQGVNRPPRIAIIDMHDQ
jgi:4-amino-4-deoxy-L-arabinose transferase-like glycosyltransferase